MAKEITITHPDGTATNYRSTIFRGYHRHEGSNGVCITEKTLFEPERIVACYRHATASEKRCLPCEVINPTQRTEYRAG